MYYSKKFKVEKKDGVFYNPESKLLSNGHWLVKMNPAFATNDAELNALISAGVKFNRNSFGGGIQTGENAYLPKMESVFSGTMPENAKKADPTGWAFGHAGGREGWTIEYSDADGSIKIYFAEKYVEMADALGADLYFTDENSHAYLKGGGDAGEVIGLLMPVKGPERGRK